MYPAHNDLWCRDPDPYLKSCLSAPSTMNNVRSVSTGQGPQRQDQIENKRTSYCKRSDALKVELGGSNESYWDGNRDLHKEESADQLLDGEMISLGHSNTGEANGAQMKRPVQLWTGMG